MNSCAYCGKTIDSQSFICEACSDPKHKTKETPLEANKTPVPQKQLETSPQEDLPTEKPILVEQHEDNSNKSSSLQEDLEQNKNPEQDSAEIISTERALKTPEIQTKVNITDNLVKTVQKTSNSNISSNEKDNLILNSSAWTEEPINKDLSSKVVIFNLVLIVLPLVAMVLVALLIKMDSILKIEVIIVICMFFAVSAVAHFIEMRWLKYASYIHKITKPVDAYIYLKSNNPVQIQIYDEDSMYPEFFDITSISPKTGNVELLGIKPRKLDELVPVKVKVGQYGPLKAMIIEANNHRVWCKFKEKNDN